MAVVDTYEAVPPGSKTGRRRKCGRFRCDECNVIFVAVTNLKKRLAHLTHYCGPDCVEAASQEGHAIDRKRRQTNLNRFGYENAFEVSEIQVANAFRAQSPTANAAREQTNIEHYGVASIWYRSDVQCLNAMNANTSSANMKREQTNLARFGVNYVFVRADVREAAAAACSTNEARRKRYHTMCRNGTHRRSSYEHRLEALLVTRYGRDSVVAQDVSLTGHRHPLDFYVKSIDTFIEVDGEYWHGLDRPIDVIARLENKGDAKVMAKWQWDRALDRRCRDEGVTLVRITDRELDSPNWDFDAWAHMIEQKVTHGST